MRFICRTLALAVNDAVHDGDFLSKVLEHIKSISKFLNYHTKVAVKLVELQCSDFVRDRIVTLEK